MKKSMLATCIVLVTVLLIGCKKGDTGSAGPQGWLGTPNVIQYSLGGNSLTTHYSLDQLVSLPW
jgi:hypothetical protein